MTKRTRRKIQQVMDTEPRRPEAASRAVRGIVPSPIVDMVVCSVVKERKFGDKTMTPSISGVPLQGPSTDKEIFI